MCLLAAVYPIRDLSWTPAPWEPKDTQKSLCQIWQSPTIAMWVCVRISCIHTIPVSVFTLFLNMRFSLLEGSPRRGDPILHSEVFPFCHWAHHSVGQRQGDLAKKISVCVCLSLCILKWKLVALFSSKTHLSTSPPCTTYSGRPIPRPKQCCK